MAAWAESDQLLTPSEVSPNPCPGHRRSPVSLRGPFLHLGQPWSQEAAALGPVVGSQGNLQLPVLRHPAVFRVVGLPYIPLGHFLSLCSFLFLPFLPSELR